VSFRVTAEVQARAEAVAAARGQTVSALAREALERYLAS
jgi:predicted DNA-binding protein